MTGWCSQLNGKMRCCLAVMMGMALVGWPALMWGQDLQIAGKIAFQSNRDGNLEIYTMTPDGSNLTRLTNNTVTDGIAYWSPDGSKIAFLRVVAGNHQVFTMNADGSNATQLTSTGDNLDKLAWSPDGTKIAFGSNRDGNQEIYVMNADGTEQTRLTNNAATDADPSWSPDGSKIAFYSMRDGNQEIYTMNMNGSNQIRLNSHSAEDTEPAWSPDGSKIAFLSNRGGNYDIYTINSDGSNVVRITSNSGTDRNARWSPDGTKIVFQPNRDDNDEIYVMNADGSGQIRLTNNGASDSEPSWTPFRLIGSVAVGSSVSRIMTIENKGGSTLSVSNITSSDGQFTVSPTNFSVNAGGSQNVTVTFTPTSAGTKYATLTISSNDPDATTAKLTVNGTGQGLFTEVGASAGVNDSGNSAGVAWGDYDGDGDLDLNVTNQGNANLLYRNNGNGTFTEVAVSAGVNVNAPSVGVAWGDYDNDGDLDFYVVQRTGGTNRLYRNNNNGTFTEVGSSAGVNDSANILGMGWGDYDVDGDIDLFVGNGNSWRLYRNNGNGTFTDVASSAGVSNSGQVAGMAWVDYDNDGDIDLYVTRPNNAGSWLYRNNGNGTFTDVSSSAGVNGTGHVHGMGWADYDNDGDLDVYVVSNGGTNQLFRNNGNGTFTEVGASVGLNVGGPGQGIGWGDYDNDGDLDLYIARYSSAGNLLYRNNGNGTFTEVGASAGVNGSGNGLGVTWGDYDGDGDLDLYVANQGGANWLYRNNGNSNRWLIVKLAGTASNKSGIGARVTAVTGSTRQRRDVVGGTGYTSQPSLPVEFGFGSTSTVDSLIVRWPNGTVQVQTNVATNQVLTVTEPLPIIKILLTPLTFRGSGSQTVAVSDSGNANLTVIPTIAGIDAAQFGVTPGGTTTIAPGATQTFTVAFSPSPASGNNRTATLQLEHNATNKGTPLTVSLVGDVPPNVPTGLTAAPGDKQDTLTWTANTESDMAYYVVYRSTTNNFIPSAADSVGRVNQTDPKVVTHTGLINDTTYYYKLVAVDMGGNRSAASVQTSVTPRSITPVPIISPVSLNFGNVRTTTSKALAFTVGNSGNASLSVSSISVAGTDAGMFSVIPASLTVNPGEAAKTVMVTFSPPVGSQSTTPKSASVSLVHNASGSPSSVPLTGMATAPVIQVSPSSLSFGNVAVGQSKNSSLTVSNTGTDTLFVSSVGISGINGSEFTVSPSKLTVLAGSSGTMMVTFTPTTAGDKTVTLTLNHNFAPIGTPTTVSLGTGNTPPLPPTGLTATVNNNQVTLTWAANTELDLSHYVVYRSTGVSALGDSVGRVDRPASFPNTGLGTGTYYYQIKAVDTAGNKSGESNQAMATISPPCEEDSDPSQPYDMDPCTAALWHFDEASGTTTSDVSGNRNTGRLNNARRISEGQFGRALDLDGRGYVSVRNTPSLNSPTALTVEAWIYPRSYTTQWNAGIVVKWGTGGAGDDSYELTLDPTGRVSFRTSDGTGTEAGTSSVLSNAVIPLNTWTHVAGTFAIGETIKVYINGTLDKSVLAKNVNIQSTTQEVWIGQTEQGPLRGIRVNGFIDEVRISNIARTYPLPPPDDCEPDEFEPDDTTAEAQDIGTSGEIQDHTLCSQEVDHVVFSAVARKKYTIRTEGDIDLKLQVSGAGVSRQINNNNGAGGNELETLLFSRAGRVTVRIEGNDLGTTGFYAISVKEFGLDAYEPDNSPATTTPLEIGEVQEHTIHQSNDTDHLSFAVEPGIPYLLTLQSDMGLQLRVSGAGLSRTFRDSRRVGGYSHELAFTRAGTVTVRISRMGSPTTGSYNISMQEASARPVVQTQDLRGTGGTPQEYALLANYPNPFNSSTTIRYLLPEVSEVQLVVYNLMGQPVRVLVQDRQEAGHYEVTWDGKDGQGQPVSSGIYLYRLASQRKVETRRMLLLK